MAIDPEMQDFVQEKVDQYGSFKNSKLGDTPTDALQLTPKKYVDGRVTGGSVNSDGTSGTPFPTGWSSSRLNVGRYQITHTLGTNNYAVTTNPTVNFLSNSITAKTSTTFNVSILDPSTGVHGFVDSPFYFIVVNI